jgi:hypothetical protein
MQTITVEGNLVHVVSPEGKKAQVPIQDLLQQAAPPRMHSCGVVLPQGTRLIFSQGNYTALVHETPPRVYGFKWIAPGSSAPYGTNSSYRTVQIALPYLVVLAVFRDGLISDVNECFFRVSPLDTQDDELFFPALLNCSRYRPPDGKPLSWICTQKLDRSRVTIEKDPARRMRAGFRALLHCLLETGFNYSSEHHEGSSWFTESTHLDPRIATVEKWQEASSHDPLFTLQVPWLKTGLSVKHVVERIFDNCQAHANRLTSAGDLARIAFNLQPTT